LNEQQQQQHGMFNQDSNQVLFNTDDLEEDTLLDVSINKNLSQL
jgi:hypothetical protein